MDKQTLTPANLDSTSLAALTEGANASVYYADPASIRLGDPFNNATPNLQPAAGSPALSVAAKFDLSGTLDDAFFEKVTYLGAFDGSADWTSGWAVWGK